MGKGNTSLLSLSWLVIYNAAQTVGWSLLGYKMLSYFMDKQTNSGLYNEVELLLLTFQSAAVMEIVHAYTKIVPSNTALTTLQVFSRVWLLWCVMYMVKGVQNSYGVAMALSAWTITEIIRYSYYVFGLFENIPYVLLWLRYSLFVFLYPLGVTGELVTIYDSLGPVREKGIMSYPMPNSLNFVFYYPFVLCCFFFAYMFYFPKLYFHMFAQRKKNLGITVAKKVE